MHELNDYDNSLQSASQDFDIQNERWFLQKYGRFEPCFLIIICQLIALSTGNRGGKLEGSAREIGGTNAPNKLFYTMKWAILCGNSTPIVR